MSGQDHTKVTQNGAWGSSGVGAPAIMTYTNHKTLAEEYSVHERADKWNGPQTVTLRVDMINRHITWTSDTHSAVSERKEEPGRRQPPREAPCAP